MSSGAQVDTPPLPEMAEVERAFARCFSGRDGRIVLAYLRSVTVERALGPDAEAAALRHLEGQRQLVGRMTALAARGRGGG